MPEFDDLVVEVAEVFRALAREAPPNLGGGFTDLLTALKSANRVRKLPAARQKALAELMTMSIGDYLDHWFESDALKGVFGFEGVIGNMVSPYNAGSAYVLVHHAFGQIDGRTAAWGHARGGMGAITQAMARSAAARGVTIDLEAPVARVIVEQGRARGVELADGTPSGPGGRVQRQSPAAVPGDGGARRPRAGIRPRHGVLALPLRHLPHERGAVGTAALLLPGRTRAIRPSSTAPSISRRRSAIWNAPMTTPRPAAGPASR